MNLTFKSTEPLLQLSYEIFNNDKIFSKLEFIFGYRYRKPATATLGDREVSLDSWLLGNIENEIKDSKTQEVIAKYYSRFLSNKGTLKLDNKEYTLSQNKSGPKYSWILENGKETIIYTLKGFMLNSGEIQVSPGLEKNPHLKLLVTVGLYQILVTWRWNTKASKSAIIVLGIVFAIFILTLIYIFYLMQNCQSC